MKPNLRQKNSISGLAAFLVFGIFAVCVLTVLLLGADTYQKLHQRDQEAFSKRTCVQYLSTRVRQAGGSGVEGIADVGGKDALVLRETIEGEEYKTYIYCYDGWIREYFCVADSDETMPEPEFGEQILEADSLTLHLDQGLLTAEIVQGEEMQQVNLFLRGTESGVAP